ncbi:ABC transporter permease [Polaribacter litorisediminis]|uniref:ABC transporter permease n=1 Tax=Polaribacter litorisediminis TaxID=1908341 RepID=UPI001CC163FC|nr:ABC transporter permease [Polaribacter litorisediminis]UAM98180.1 ABC transporter permease [Polaribacter litorisediminis]
MNTINYFTKSIQNEIIKLKSTFTLWLVFISAVFIPVIYFFYYLLKSETLIPAEGVNPWGKFMTQQISVSASLLIPMFIILITSLIIQIEHKSSSLKYLFSLPVPKWSIYFGKLTVSVGLILFIYILFFFAMLAVGSIVGLIHNELNFLDYFPNYQKPLKLLFRSFIAILGIVGIQFWISFIFKNFITPLGIGIVLVITGLIVYKTGESLYFPYSYSSLSLVPLSTEESNISLWFPKVAFLSLCYFITFSILGFLSISKMNVK